MAEIDESVIAFRQGGASKFSSDILPVVQRAEVHPIVPDALAVGDDADAIESRGENGTYHASPIGIVFPSSDR